MFPNNYNPNLGQNQTLSPTTYGFQQGQQYPPQYCSGAVTANPFFVQLPPQQRASNPLPGVQRMAINGRIVASEAEITPQEIPMDGSISIFPASDYSCIYGKTWAADGSIKTCKFVPAVEAPAQDIPSFEERILSRLDELEAMISTAIPKARAKKEEAGNV